MTKSRPSSFTLASAAVLALALGAGPVLANSSGGSSGGGHKIHGGSSGGGFLKKHHGGGGSSGGSSGGRLDRRPRFTTPVADRAAGPAVAAS